MKPKTCPRCGGKEPKVVFGKNSSRSDGKSQTCKKCKNTHQKKKYDENPEKRWINQLKSKYGITPERYAEMENAQGGCCAICDRPTPGKHLAVDHNHVTGEVRALLCSNCNRGIGHFQDSSNLLRNAAQYLDAATYEDRLHLDEGIRHV